MAGGLDWRVFKVLSNPDHSRIQTGPAILVLSSEATCLPQEAPLESEVSVKKSLEISGTLGSALSCQIPAPDVWWDRCWIHKNDVLSVLLNLDIEWRIWKTAGRILLFHTPAEVLGAANPAQRIQ